MLTSFHLGAIAKRGNSFSIRRVPLAQNIQTELQQEWSSQYNSFSQRSTDVEFSLGYGLEDDQVFLLEDFPAPPWLLHPTTVEFPDINKLETGASSLREVRGLAGFTSHSEHGPLILFQNFTASRVIRPRSYLILTSDTFSSTDNSVIRLDTQLSAVYRMSTRQLRMLNYRVVNTFLPLDENFREATANEIRQVLQHPSLRTSDADKWASEDSQWFRKRFAMLKTSTVLDDYSVEVLRERGGVHSVDVDVVDGRIEFPDDKPSAKKLLQLLTEELFLGAISGDLYETNSKKKADVS